MTVGRTAPPNPTIAVGILATGVGGALGAVARWSLTSTFPVSTGQFPWTVFVINVVGSALLAALPLLRAVHRRPWLPLFLGTGVLGGFTTMSAASADTFALVDHGAPVLAAAYSLGTLFAAVVTVLAVERLVPAEQRGDFEAREGDE